MQDTRVGRGEALLVLVQQIAAKADQQWRTVEVSIPPGFVDPWTHLGRYDPCHEAREFFMHPEFQPTLSINGSYQH
eukprot:4044919-Karenia_brevis.AAC.1